MSVNHPRTITDQISQNLTQGHSHYKSKVIYRTTLLTKLVCVTNDPVNDVINVIKNVFQLP